MKDVIVEATVMDRTGVERVLTNSELELGYRTSVVAKNNLIVTDVILELEKSDAQKVKAYVSELAARRRDKQPLEYPSAGSTFKRPEGFFAGKLIEDSGLKGYAVGGAKVSDKHAGFVINSGDATARDIIDLTDSVANIVEEKFGVKLELEIKKLGFN